MLLMIHMYFDNKHKLPRIPTHQDNRITTEDTFVNRFEDLALPEDASESEVVNVVQSINNDISSKTPDI